MTWRCKEILFLSVFNIRSPGNCRTVPQGELVGDGVTGKGATCLELAAGSEAFAFVPQNPPSGQTMDPSNKPNKPSPHEKRNPERPKRQEGGAVVGEGADNLITYVRGGKHSGRRCSARMQPPSTSTSPPAILGLASESGARHLSSIGAAHLQLALKRFWRSSSAGPKLATIRPPNPRRR